MKVAALRALHQIVDEPVIFRDPLAAPILDAEGLALLDGQRADASETARLRATLAVRAVVAEDVICQAVGRGVRQVVILGAGLDTFAYRHGHLAARVFEVDHPATQAAKRRMIRDAGIEVPESVRYVAADFVRDDLFAALGAADLDGSRAMVFSMLGVTFYLDRETLLGLLRGIRSWCAGNVDIVFDYTEPFHDAAPSIRAIYEAAAARVAAAGEPWASFYEPAALHRALRDLRFDDITDLDAATLQRRYCEGRIDGLRVSPLVHLLRAGYRRDATDPILSAD